MDGRSAGRCERCGNTRPGSDYGFWYGAVKTTAGATNEAPTITEATIGGSAAAFICDQCIDDRRRRLRRIAVILPTISFLVLLGIGLGHWIVENEVGAILLLGTMAILFGPVLAPVLLWLFNRNPDFGPDRTGWMYATRARAKALGSQGYFAFWRAEEMPKIREIAARTEAARIEGASGGAEYRFVRDGAGTITGIWLRDAPKAGDRNLLLALLMKHGESPTTLLGGVRVVPNTYDGSGGSFAMFGDAAAPGER